MSAAEVKFSELLMILITVVVVMVVVVVVVVVVVMVVVMVMVICLVWFYSLATSKVISGRKPTCNSAHSW